MRRMYSALALLASSSACVQLATLARPWRPGSWLDVVVRVVSAAVSATAARSLVAFPGERALANGVPEAIPVALARETPSAETKAREAPSLSSARERAPDAVVTDMVLARLSSDALVAALRADASLRSVPVLLLRSRADDEKRIKLLSDQAIDYLLLASKAVDIEVLALEMCTRLKEHGEPRR